MSWAASSSTAWSEVGIPLSTVPARPVPPAPQPHELLDDGFPPEPCDLLVIGCGNILRGDDAVGPVLVRHLHEHGTPPGVRLVDGGTAGMDVAFGMRGARRVVIVDAAQTGAPPGTLYRVPAHELASLPPIDGLHTHNFRWDHALSFSTWLLGPLRPTDVTVLLVEAGQLEPGEPLSEPVRAGMEQVITLLEREFYPTGPARPDAVVELTAAGYLHVPAALAATRFPADVCLARVEGDGEDVVLVLVPLADVAHGGLVLRQYTPRGDRTVLLSEVFGFSPVAGTFPSRWDRAEGALRVPLRIGGRAEGGSDGARGADGGRAGERTVDGLPPGDLPRGGAAGASEDLPDRAEGPTDGLGGDEGRSPSASATGGTR